MLSRYLSVFFLSMVPLIELRGGVALAVGMNLPYLPALAVCVLGNMLPVPLIYFFARKILYWGENKRYIGKFCRFWQKLVARTGRYGALLALMLFVGIPLPGTGAWTGTLAASFLDMGFKTTVIAVCLGVILAGFIMGAASTAVFHFIGF